MGSEDKKKMIFVRWRTDFDFKTILNAHGSLLVTFLFALYNGFLGLWHSSFWHGSIGVYYILLVLIRGTIIGTERRLFSQRNHDGKSSKDGKALKDAKAAREKESAGKVRRAVYQVNVVLLLILNICMIGPIMMLVRLDKPVHMTLIPAIAMAAYSTYKITIASINYRRRRKSANCLVRLLRTINFVDALMSVITLQNTLIMVAGTGDRGDMLPLSAVSSGAMWLMTVLLTISALRMNKK